MVAVIAPKKTYCNKSQADTNDMLAALRKQLQPHLVMALQGHKTMSYPNLQVSFALYNIEEMFSIQTSVL